MRKGTGVCAFLWCRTGYTKAINRSRRSCCRAGASGCCSAIWTIPKSVSRPDQAVRDWLGRLQAAGIRVMILSNNRSPRRVEQFCRDLGITYVGHAKKPQTSGFRRAMDQAGTDPAHTAMLGDKLLTDMLGANLSGVTALMVEPAGGARTPWQKVLHALQAPWKHLAGGVHRI